MNKKSDLVLLILFVVIGIITLVEIKSQYGNIFIIITVVFGLGLGVYLVSKERNISHELH